MIIRLAIGLACLLGMTIAGFADILWGVNGHPFTAYPGIGIERQLDYLKDLGLRSYRVNIPDAGKASELAALVKAGKDRGIHILPVITPGNIDLEKENAKDLYDKAHMLAVTLGSRFKNDIRVWELGNEMENFAIIKACEQRDNGIQYPCEWGPAGGTSALDYYGPRWAKVSAVLKGLSDGMTAVDPEIRKAIGTAGWGHTGAFERMQQDGIKWDISVWHMYGGDPEPAFEKLARYGRPIWVTEFNNPYGSQRGEQLQAEGLKEAMTRLQELQDTYRVEAAHIYELLDETYWAPDFEAFMGLVRLTATKQAGWTTGEPKPAYFAVRDTVRGPQPLANPGRDCELAETSKLDSILAGQVNYSHCLVLGRTADEGSLESWVAALESGKTSLAAMLIAMLRSDEFDSRYATFALTDRDYISFFYRLFLDRDADTHGLDSYAQQFSDGSITRESLAFGIITSSEFQAKHSPHLNSNPGANAASGIPPG
jgi:hypothetical protein